MINKELNIIFKYEKAPMDRKEDRQFNYIFREREHTLLAILYAMLQHVDQHVDLYVTANVQAENWNKLSRPYCSILASCCTPGQNSKC